MKLTFNLEVGSGAGDAANYILTPQTEIAKAVQDENSRFIIHPAGEQSGQNNQIVSRMFGLRHEKGGAHFVRHLPL